MIARIASATPAPAQVGRGGPTTTTSEAGFEALLAALAAAMGSVPQPPVALGDGAPGALFEDRDEAGDVVAASSERLDEAGYGRALALGPVDEGERETRAAVSARPSSSPGGGAASPMLAATVPVDAESGITSAVGQPADAPSGITSAVGQPADAPRMSGLAGDALGRAIEPAPSPLPEAIPGTVAAAVPATADSPGGGDVVLPAPDGRLAPDVESPVVGDGTWAGEPMALELVAGDERAASTVAPVAAAAPAADGADALAVAPSSADGAARAAPAGVSDVADDGGAEPVGAAAHRAHDVVVRQDRAAALAPAPDPIAPRTADEAVLAGGRVQPQQGGHDDAGRERDGRGPEASAEREDASARDGARGDDGAGAADAAPTAARVDARAAVATASSTEPGARGSSPARTGDERRSSSSEGDVTHGADAADDAVTRWSGEDASGRDEGDERRERAAREGVMAGQREPARPSALGRTAGDGTPDASTAGGDGPEAEPASHAHRPGETRAGDAAGEAPPAQLADVEDARLAPRSGARVTVDLEELGQVRVQVRVRGREVHTSIEAPDERAAAALDDVESPLRTALRGRDLDLREFRLDAGFGDHPPRHDGGAAGRDLARAAADFSDGGERRGGGRGSERTPGRPFAAGPRAVGSAWQAPVRRDEVEGRGALSIVA